jgi:hypothetical protein
MATSDRRCAVCGVSARDQHFQRSRFAPDRLRDTCARCATGADGVREAGVRAAWPFMRDHLALWEPLRDSDLSGRAAGRELVRQVLGES